MKNKKKIIHIVDCLDIGGAQEIIYSLTKYIKDYKSIVISLHGQQLDQNYIENIKNHAEIIVLSQCKYNILLIIFKLIFLILKNRKNAIFNFHLEISCILGGIIRFFISFKMIISIHAHPQQLPNWKNLLFYNFTRKTDYYIAEDKDVVAYLKMKKVNNNKIYYIPIGTDRILSNKKVADKNIREEFNISPDYLILLNIARMVPGKGQHDLIVMMKELRDIYPKIKAHLIIVGYGHEYTHLVNATEKNQLQDIITFTGKRTDLHNFYTVADWFLMPCYDESMGVVIYEALGYGVPVIAYDSGSIGEVILDEDMGFLIDKNPQKMAELIARITVTHIKNNLMKKDLSYFSAERMVDNYLGVYNLT